jgi:FecR protein
LKRKRLDPELRKLIDAALAGDMTDAEQDRLDARLREDDAALEAFLDYCQLETDLFFHVRATLAGRRFLADARFDESGAEAAGGMVDRSLNRKRATLPQTGWSWYLLDRKWWLSLAVALVLGAFAWWVSSSWYVIPAERQPQPIAAYIGGQGVEWLDDEAPAVGHQFVEGESAYLKKGEARISMANGAELVLWGPCFVTLATADRVQLEEGVVTAQVAEWGRGFTVKTEALQAVDLGTKFAVSASSLGAAEAHVLDGQVRIQPASTAVTDRRSLLLSGGEAIRVESQRHLATRLAANRERYDADLGDRPPFKPIQIFNTGRDLEPGDEDPHWRVTAGPQSQLIDGPEFAVVAAADGRYLANDRARSQWISLTNPVRPGCSPRSQFTFETMFDLTGYDLSTVMIAAQVIADNGVRAVRINGQPVAIKPWELNEKQQYFNKFQVVEIKERFVPGVNRIEFDVWNGVDQYAPEAPNPMSLRVEWQAFGRLTQPARADAKPLSLPATAGSRDGDVPEDGAKGRTA